MAQYIDRELEKMLLKSQQQFPALALTGPRQSGKSTLLKELFGTSHTTITLDDPVVREQAVSDPRLFLEMHGPNILLDEIQYVPQLLSYIKILIDEDRDAKGRFILTGSQQFNLIKGLGDTLAGRIAVFDLLPFSMAEKMRVPDISGSVAHPKDLFVHGCVRGSFPELSVSAGMDPAVWYGSYLQTYLERDIRSLHNVGSLREFQRFLTLLAGRCAQMLNLSSMATDIGVSVNTIKHWVSLLEAGRIIYLLPPYYRNMGKRITKNPKVYFLDTGLVCHLTGITTPELVVNGPMAGPLFENYIMQETVKFFFNHGRRPPIYYVRTYNGLEVDLIIEQGQTLHPYECKLTGTPGPGMATALQRFTARYDALDVAPGTVVCLADRELPLTRTVSAIGPSAFITGLQNFI